jgi:hydroxyacylglutathione hydrolase
MKMLACAMVVSVVGCASSRPWEVGVIEGNTVVQVPLDWSNVFVVQREASVMLIDSGSPQDLPALEAALAARGLTTSSLRCVVLTHGHADHAGLARPLQEQGALVVAGAGDAPMLAQGKNRPLQSQNLMGRLLRPRVDFPFAPVTPDLAVEGPLTLERCGFPEVWVEPLPGHTPGSVVVWLSNGEAFVGDLALGGSLGGALNPHSPQGHYFHDAAQNAAKAEALVARGAVRLFLGHGGPVDARGAAAALR